MNDFIKEYNERAEKHNKRVKSLREQRIPKAGVIAIDQAISAMSEVHDQVCEGVIHGYNSLMMEDVIKLVTALQELRNQFNYREMR